MYGLTREEGSLGANPGAKDLARHLFSRMYCGKVVIVTDRPVGMHSSLRKQWLKLARKVSKERSSTLDASRILRLNDMVTRMLTLEFSTDWPDDYQADVFIATAEQLLQWAPDCRTLYVTCEMSTEKLYLITAMMPKGGLMIACHFQQSS